MGLRWSPTDSGTVCVAYSTPRRLGSAVVRNRIRRRLRAVFSQIASSDPLLLPPGDYLVAPRVSVATLPRPALVESVRAALADLETRRPRCGASS